ncbi:hypothetical protein MPSI1_000667 [Malassezia psittaci]|uniref:Pirin n=1 Tax=Malassezia psittaci TaxID=1821823 RepID=A0AAF0JD42_9BASI|nr:hypothetical protein MPSI1_000667 [Malassezia psittaci]
MTSSALKQISRKVTNYIAAVEQSEGAGARVRRALGTSELRNFSPFLMLDHFRIGEGAGFTDHPHRGQTTVTYMLDGYVEHEDFAGHRGVIGPGDVQWMMAARGIVHAEMPLTHDEKGNKLPIPIGMQLWIDLPAHAKKEEASYQEFKSDQLPVQVPRASEPKDTEGQGWSVKIISGNSHGAESPVRLPQSGGCYYMDIQLQPGGWIFQEIPHTWNALLYIIENKVSVGSESSEVYDQYHTLTLSNPGLKSETAEEAKIALSNNDGVRINNPSNKPSRVILIAAEPMDHPVVQYGPFVMCSKKEIYEAIQDFQLARNGFERAANWHSEIAKRL